MGNLEKPDYTQYVKGQKDYCVKGVCTASCLEEIKSCKNYDPSRFFNVGGCDYLGSRSGKCLRPENE